MDFVIHIPQYIGFITFSCLHENTPKNKHLVCKKEYVHSKHDFEPLNIR